MNISITKDTITPELARLLAAVQRPRALYAAGAKAVQVQISEHLRRLQARGNKMGWPAQKFFAGKSTSVEKRVGISRLDDTGAVVTIADPRFVHRIEGGTVKPKRRKYLAIPLTDGAYAKANQGSIRESLPGLVLIKTPKGLLLVMSKASGRGKSKTVKIIPMFKLVRSVTHAPHPDEMPPLDQLSTAARNAMFAAAKLLFKAR